MALWCVLLFGYARIALLTIGCARGGAEFASRLDSSLQLKCRNDGKLSASFRWRLEDVNNNQRKECHNLRGVRRCRPRLEHAKEKERTTQDDERLDHWTVKGTRRRTKERHCAKRAARRVLAGSDEAGKRKQRSNKETREQWWEGSLGFRPQFRDARSATRDACEAR